MEEKGAYQYKSGSNNTAQVLCVENDSLQLYVILSTDATDLFLICTSSVKHVDKFNTVPMKCYNCLNTTSVTGIFIQLITCRKK